MSSALPHRPTPRTRRRRIALALATAAGAALGSVPAVAAPAPQVETVTCDQLGEVELELQGPAQAPTGARVRGNHLVRLAAPVLARTAGTVEPAVAGAVMCRSERYVTAATFDDAEVLADASGRTVRAAAVTNDPAGYGPVEAFPYAAQLSRHAASRPGSLALAHRAQGSMAIQSFVKGSATNVTASIVKVQVMATVMHQAQQAGRGLTSWEKSQMVPMIRNSDNAATTNLWNHVGRGPAVARVISLMGLRQTTPGPAGYWGLTVTSAPDQVVLMDHFARRNPVLTDANRAYGLSLMRTVASDQDWGVTAGPGDDIAVKNGWLPRSDGWHVNSIGFNHKAPRAYSAAALTHSSSAGMSTQVATIEGASRIVWGHAMPARGDWTGDGRADVLGVRDGNLHLFPGQGAGRLGPARQVGSGWGSMTWIGVPGDVDRDGRTDLLARRSDGTLHLYRGTGNGALVWSRRVGTGWNGITAFATVGDFDGDREADLLARSSTGDLLRYRLPAQGGAVAAGRVGTSWNGMRRVIGVNGINNDLRGDVLALRADGGMFAYTSTGTALRGGTQVGHGWRPALVASPGDLTGDGVDDVVYQTSTGLSTYPVRRGGSFASPVATGADLAGWSMVG